MEGKEAIIASIISAAELSAQNIISDAESQKSALLLKTREECERKRAQLLEKAEEDGRELLKRNEALCSLERRKSMLAAKQRVIGKVYSEVLNKVMNMTDNVYRDFIAGVISKNAENGDEVVVAKRDIRRLHYDWLLSLESKLKLTLTLSPDCHGGQGGIILRGKNWDKNLTLESMIAELRPRTESWVAAKIFEQTGSK